MIKRLVLFFCMASGLCSCTWTQALWFSKEVVEHYPQDNPIEEYVEEQIGVDDLTPWSPEE